MIAGTAILYSTGCPKCKILKQKLDGKGVPYTENNSVDEMLSLGITQVPVLSVGGELLPFAKAIEWVNKVPMKEVQDEHSNQNEQRL